MNSAFLSTSSWKPAGSSGTSPGSATDTVTWTKTSSTHVEDLLAVADVVTELPLLSPVSRDPDDDHVIAAALAAGAAVIVSGDDDLLSLEADEGIRMLTVQAFHDQWTP